MQQKDARITKLKAKMRSLQVLEKIFYSVFKIKNYKILLAADEQKEKKNKLPSDWLVKML